MDPVHAALEKGLGDSLNFSILRRLKARLYFRVQSSVSRSWVVSTIRDSSVVGFYFGSILVISSGHCCVDFFRAVFGVRGFSCGSLLFLSFVFVRGASVLRTDSLVVGWSSLTHR